MHSLACFLFARAHGLCCSLVDFRLRLSLDALRTARPSCSSQQVCMNPRLLYQNLFRAIVYVSHLLHIHAQMACSVVPSPLTSLPSPIALSRSTQNSEFLVNPTVDTRIAYSFVVSVATPLIMWWLSSTLGIRPLQPQQRSANTTIGTMTSWALVCARCSLQAYLELH